MLTTGFILALVFDFYRALRSLGYLGDIITKLIDFSFCILAGVIVFIILLRANLGEIRFYIFLSLLLGALIYNQTLSSFFLRFFSSLWAEFFKLINKFLKVIKKIYKFFKNLLKRLQQILFKFKSKLSSFLD